MTSPAENKQQLRRPTIVNIMASSLDGRSALHRAESTRARLASGLSSEADGVWLKRQIASCDAVFIGARSLAAERGALRVKGVIPSSMPAGATDSARLNEPAWMVFTAGTGLSPAHGFWLQEGIQKSLVTCTGPGSGLHTTSVELAGAQVPFLVGDLACLLEHFYEQGLRRVALLGGGTLNGLFWSAGVVDRLVLTLSPVLVGNSLGPGIVETDTPWISPLRLRLESVSQDGDLLFLEYATQS